MEAWNKIKFSDYDIQSIIKRYKELKSTRKVAEEFNVSKGTVSKILKENGIKSLVLEHQRDQKLQNAVIPFEPQIFEDLANLSMSEEINEALYTKYDEFLVWYGIILPKDATEEDKNNYKTKIQLFVMGLQAQIDKKAELYKVAIHYTADEIKAMDTPDKDKLLEIKKNIAPFETLMPTKGPTEEYKKELQGYLDIYNDVYADSKPSFSADYGYSQLLDIVFSHEEELSMVNCWISYYPLKVIYQKKT